MRRLQEPAERDRETVKAGKSLPSSIPEGKLSRWSRTEARVPSIRGKICQENLALKVMATLQFEEVIALLNHSRTTRIDNVPAMGPDGA